MLILLPPLVQGYTALHAVAYGKVSHSCRQKMALCILKSGANVYIRDKGGETPIQAVALHKHWDMLEVMLPFCGSSYLDQDKASWLWVAIKRGLTAASWKDLQQATCETDLLHMSAQCSSCQSVAFLLGQGWQVDARRVIDGQTALHVAVLANSERVVQLLLAFSADMSIIDKAGRTVVYHAAHDGRLALVKLLLDQAPLLLDSAVQVRVGSQAS